MSDFKPGLEGVVAFETEIAEPGLEVGHLRFSLPRRPITPATDCGRGRLARRALAMWPLSFNNVLATSR